VRSILFCNEMLGLGHLRLSLALATALVDQRDGPARGDDRAEGGAALVVTGSVALDSALNVTGVDVLKLPTLPVGAHSSWSATSLRPPSGLAIGEEGVGRLRAELCLAAVRELRPQIAVVDYRPFGRGGDLRPALEWLRSDGHCTIALGLWDVDDSPSRLRSAWTAEHARQVSQIYDLALVYGNPPPGDVRVEALRTAGLPVHETGLVGAPAADAPAHDLGEGYLLAIAGGGVDGFTMLQVLLEAIRRRPLPVRTVVVAGPMMPAAQAEELRCDARGLDVLVEHSRRDMAAVLRGARAVISMAGYCTVAEVLGSGAPALFVPRAFPREEQLNRARRWAASGRVEMCHPDSWDPAGCRDAIERLLHRNSSPGLPLTGALDAARILRARGEASAPLPRASRSPI
jgi:predicted glycosyltransferase